MANTNTPRCTGNCMNCAMIQRQFCASQLAYNNMKVLDVVAAELKALKETVEKMKHDDEAVLFNPSDNTKQTAQEEDGA